MEIPFIGGAYTARSSNLNAQTCINLFPVIDNQQAKTVLSLFGTPGLVPFVQFDQALTRYLYVVSGYLYAIIANTIYKISSAGTYTTIGAIATISGFLSIADNGIEIIIVDGSSTAVLINIITGTKTNASLPANISCITFQDGYFIGLEKDSKRFYISGLYDGSVWDAADVATIEGRSSNMLMVISNTSDLWFLGETSIEVYFNSGNADFPFDQVPGSLIDTGIGAKASLTKIDNSLYWVTNKNRVCYNSGYQVQYISTPEIDYQLSTYSVIEDAIGFTYNVDGHDFYALVFPTAEKTWCYDIFTNYWHEWQSYQDGVTPYSRHRANCSAFFDGSWVVGDYENGSLYKLSMNTYTDNLNPIKRQRAGINISKERKNLIWHSFEVEFESGVGLSGGVQGSDPQAIFDWSTDGGHTWSNQRWKPIGKIGEYRNRVKWRGCGMSISRIPRITIYDPVKVVILGAYADLEECSE